MAKEKPCMHFVEHITDDMYITTVLKKLTFQVHMSKAKGIPCTLRVLLAVYSCGGFISNESGTFPGQHASRQ